MKETDLILEVRNLKVNFHTYRGEVKALNGVDLQIYKREVLGLVGESGCGKSVTALTILDLLPDNASVISGEILFKGTDLLQKSNDERRLLRVDDFATVFQDPMTSLNPVLTVGFQITEALKLHQGVSDAQAREQAAELLNLVGIPNATERLDDYQHQFSGGMRQRAMIAMGLSTTRNCSSPTSPPPPWT